jgi:ribosomal protein L29
MARLKGSDLRQLDTAELERKLATLRERFLLG